MGRLIKWLFILMVLGAIVIVGYAYIGDFQAPTQEIRTPVEIDVD